MKEQVAQDQMQELRQQYLILKNQAYNLLKSGDINTYLKKLIELQKSIHSKDLNGAF
ncbi:MAG: hypothetical protein WD048_04820 [Chitinophagales bacterium]